MEILSAILELISKYGLTVVVIALIVGVAFMFSRTWTKARDANSTREETYNAAQNLINQKFTDQDRELADLRKLGNDNRATINTLETQLADAKRHISILEETVKRLESDKTQIAGERDRVRTDLNKANDRIRELEQQVSKLEGELKATREMQTTVIQPLIDSLRQSVPVAVVVTPPDNSALPTHED